MYLCVSTSSWKNPECSGKCTATNVSKISAVLLAVWAEPGEYGVIGKVEPSNCNPAQVQQVHVVYYLKHQKSNKFSVLWDGDIALVLLPNINHSDQ